MSKAVKFSSKIDEGILRDLRAHAEDSHQSVSGILTEAVREYLERVKVRPAFLMAADAVLDENAELLERLAK